MSDERDIQRRVIEPFTASWWECRIGAWTASRAPSLMATTKKGEPTAAYADLIGEIASERLTGLPATHFVTNAMQRGIDLEPEAAEAYALDRMVTLGESALVVHPTLPRVCATPDRFVGDDGLLEIKVPSVQLKHLDTLRDGRKSIVHEYRDQCLWQLWTTGRDYCDLASFYPEFPPAHRLAVVRIERDEERFAAFEAAIERAEGEVSEILDALEAITPGQREGAA